MKHPISTVCTALATLLLPASSHAVDWYYFGAALGATRHHGDYADQVTRARSSDPAPPTDIHIDTDNGAAGRIFFGARIAPSFALEADYADLGRLTTHAMWHGVDPVFQFERFGRIKVRAAAISLVASAPLTARLDIFGRAGAAYTWVDYETRGTAFDRAPDGTISSFPSPTPPDRSGNGTRGVLALGLQHRFGDRWSVRAEWARYFRLGADFTSLQERGKLDLDLATLGLTYRF